MSYTHDELIAVRDRLQGVLAAAAQARSEREYPVQEYPGYSPVPAWVLYERYQMLCAVNLELAVYRNPGPIDIKAIERCERLAVGSVDYAEKFALGCAELVLNLRGEPL